MKQVKNLYLSYVINYNTLKYRCILAYTQLSETFCTLYLYLIFIFSARNRKHTYFFLGLISCNNYAPNGCICL